MPKRIYFRDEENPFDSLPVVKTTEYRDEVKSPETVAIKTEDITKTSPTDFSKIASDGNISKKIDEPSTRIDTSIITTAKTKNFGTSSRSMTAASGTETIAHGLTTTPKKVIINAKFTSSTNADIWAHSTGIYDGTNTKTLHMAPRNGSGLSGIDTTNIIVMNEIATPTSQVATISVDATNITLTWTKTGIPASNTAYFIWEVEG